MQKRRIALLVTAVLLVFLSVVSIVINSKQIVTGSVKDLDKIDIYITAFRNSFSNNQSKRITLENEAQLDEVFNMLVNTKKVRFLSDRKIKSRDYWFQHDRRFFIDIYYSSGKIEKFESTESGEGIFRSGKMWFIKGYFIGENVRLWEYISSIAK